MAILKAPGTLAVVLPKYQAPEFTAPTVPIGGVVTTVTFEGSLDNKGAFTFGQVFRSGEFTPVDGLVGRIDGFADIALQVDVKATYDDGSVRHALISGITHAIGVMHMIRSVKSVAVAEPANPSDFTCTVNITVAGEEYIAKTSTTGITWLSGAIVAEKIGFSPLVNTNGVAHPYLTVQFAPRVYVNGQVKLDVVVEHTKAYLSTADITYDISIKVGTDIVYSKTALTHFPCARYKKTFWYGGKPNLHIKHNTAYLISTKAVANYDQSVKMSEATLAGYATALASTTFEPMGKGRFMAAMGTTGGRPDIGLAPDCYAATVLSMDKRAKDLMLASADVGGSWSTHRRDVDGNMFDVLHYPKATILGTPSDSLNYTTGQPEKLPALLTKTTLSQDTSHQPAFAYIPYLLTGDYFYLEELQFWCNYNIYNSNPAYRFAEKGGIQSDQVRGQGWSIRTLAEAAYLTPDAMYNKASFLYWLNNNMEWYRLQYTDGTDNKLGFISGKATVYPSAGGVNTGMAPWQDDFFTQAVGHCAELGNKEATRLLRWKAKFQVGRMIADGYCWIQAATYSLRVRETQTSPYYNTLADCWKNGVEPDRLTLGCNTAESLAALNASRPLPSSPYKLNEIIGYSYSTDGFPSNYQPALAMAVDSGYEGGDKAWSMFSTRASQPDYSTSPQFAIVPRKLGSDVIVPPTPVIPPVVVPEPPVVLPPRVEPPVSFVTITNTILANEIGLTVVLENGPLTLIYLAQVANTVGEVKISDSKFIKGVSYTCKVINSLGYTVATTFPIKAI